METKVCSKCGEKKALTEFYKEKKQADGYNRKCKLCIYPNLGQTEKNRTLLRDKGLKKCSSCKQIKPLEMFNKNKHKYDGLLNYCKSCQKERYKKDREVDKKRKAEKYALNVDEERKKQKIYRETNREKLKKYRQKRYLKHKDKMLYKSAIYREANRDYLNEQGKKYYHNNKERVKKYREDNKESRREWRKQYNKTYAKERRKIDLEFDLSIRIRDLIRTSIQKQYACKSGKSFDLLGCTGTEAYNHLMAKGFNRDTDHIDHIVPCRWFDLTIKEHQLVSQHYLNLQPLPAEVNLSKGDRLPANWKAKIIEICAVRNINSESIINHIENRRVDNVTGKY